MFETILISPIHFIIEDI